MVIRSRNRPLLPEADSGKISCRIRLKRKKALALPEAQRTNHFLFCVVEAVGNVCDAGGKTGRHHADKIEVYLHLCIVRILHVFIDKKIRNNGRIGRLIVINGKSSHLLHPRLTVQQS